jgi:hypothetical protein
MAYTEEQGEALRRALASGERRVSYDGRTVEYRDVAELKAALAEVEAALASDRGRRVRQIRVTTSKGF